MTTVAYRLDARALDRDIADRRHPLWWGITGMLAIETTVFASLVASYFYLRMSADAWPPEPLPLPELLLPTVNTVILLLSSIPMAYGDRAIRRGDSRKLTLGISLSILLALVFLALKAYEYLGEVGYRWSDHAYGSIVWTIVGFHSAHVMALVLKSIVVASLAAKGYFDEGHRIAVTVNGLYWHFVVVIWIPLYIVLYLAPRAI